MLSEEATEAFLSLSSLFGQATILSMKSYRHRKWTLDAWERWMIAPMTNGQFYCVVRDGLLTGFATWANLTPHAEMLFEKRKLVIQPEDWVAGDYSRIWIMDVVSPDEDPRFLIKHLRQFLTTKASDEGWPVRRAKWFRHYTDRPERLGSLRK